MDIKSKDDSVVSADEKRPAERQRQDSGDAVAMGSNEERLQLMHEEQDIVDIEGDDDGDVDVGGGGGDADDGGQSEVIGIKSEMGRDEDEEVVVDDDDEDDDDDEPDFIDVVDSDDGDDGWITPVITTAKVETCHQTSSGEVKMSSGCQQDELLGTEENIGNNDDAMESVQVEGQHLAGRSNEVSIGGETGHWTSQLLDTSTEDVDNNAGQPGLSDFILLDSTEDDTTSDTMDQREEDTKDSTKKEDCVKRPKKLIPKNVNNGGKSDKPKNAVKKGPVKKAVVASSKQSGKGGVKPKISKGGVTKTAKSKVASKSVKSGTDSKVTKSKGAKKSPVSSGKYGTKRK